MMKIIFLCPKVDLEYYKKVIIPTEQELSNHKEFLKKFKKNFF